MKNSIKCKASWIQHTGTVFFYHFPPFRTRKMEEHFLNLAASLGECSRIVSQVLESTNSCLSANVSNEVTQVLPSNSGRSAAMFQVQSNKRDPWFNAVKMQVCALA